MLPRHEAREQQAQSEAKAAVWERAAHAERGILREGSSFSTSAENARRNRAFISTKDKIAYSMWVVAMYAHVLGSRVQRLWYTLLS